jgi:hypothetical protein
VLLNVVLNKIRGQCCAFENIFAKNGNLMGFLMQLLLHNNNDRKIASQENCPFPKYYTNRPK